MKTILEIINDHLRKGMSFKQAEFYTCEEVVLTKISRSMFANSVLLKGGVVMFNLTNNLRRTTSDLDFDFIRYDISEQSIKEFVRLLNNVVSEIQVKLLAISPLHQDDYKGKRVWVLLKDSSYKIKYKMDIGVHTLLSVSQNTMCFSFGDEKPIFLKANPPEQIFTEKLFSLIKHKAFSSRYKDIYDMFYLVNNNLIDKDLFVRCINLFLNKKIYDVHSINDIYDTINSIFENENFVSNINESMEKWMDSDVETMLKVVKEFIYSFVDNFET